MKPKSCSEHIRAALYRSINKVAADPNAYAKNPNQGYRLLAVDGSDLRLPSNPSDDFSLIRNSAGQKQYNLVHLNAMYDLANKG